MEQTPTVSKLGNGRHAYVPAGAHGRNTLQMDGFPIQTYEKN